MQPDSNHLFETESEQVVIVIFILTFTTIVNSDVLL